VGKSLSLHLEITGENSSWKWKILHRRGNGNSCISAAMPFPRCITPQDAAALLPIGNLLCRTDYAQYGMNLHKAIIPAELSDLLAGYHEGDCLFEVPDQWAPIPFELLVDKNGFFCERFKIGTILHIPGVDAGRFHDSVRPLSFGVIADPAGDLPQAYNEGMMINNLLQASGCMVRTTSKGASQKIREIFWGASVVHYAGHSIFSNNRDDCGWKIKNGELLPLADLMKNTLENPPLVVFSNSCEAAKTSTGFAGVAGAFMQMGVAQIIGPFTRVTDTEAHVCAAEFFKRFIRNKHPAESLFAMKKTNSKNPAALVYRLFGDPCWIFPESSHEPNDNLSGINEKKKRSLILLWILLFVFLITVFTIFFWPLTANNGVIYIPAK
jgi:hypothetical protein